MPYPTNGEAQLHPHFRKNLWVESMPGRLGAPLPEADAADPHTEATSLYSTPRHRLPDGHNWICNRIDICHWQQIHLCVTSSGPEVVWQCINHIWTPNRLWVCQAWCINFADINSNYTNILRRMVLFFHIVSCIEPCLEKLGNLPKVTELLISRGEFWMEANSMWA